MIEPTNSVPLVTAAGQAAAAAVNDWKTVLAEVGAGLVVVYHVVCNGGGLKTIGQNFWCCKPQTEHSQPEKNNAL